MTTHKIDKAMKAMQQQAIKFQDLATAEECSARPTYYHSDIETILPGKVYYVSGRWHIKIFAPLYHLGLTYIQRGMTILRAENGELSLVNSIKLGEDGLKSLDKLGKVKNIVRIGSNHGGDDFFYSKRYPDADYWALKGMVVPEDFEKQINYMTESKLPFEGAKLLLLPETPFPEGILIVPWGPGVAVTCDAIQCNHMFAPHTSLLMSLFMKLGGFVGDGIFGPGMLDFAYKCWGKDPQKILPPFLKKFLEEPWDILCPGHSFAFQNAKEAVHKTLTNQFDFKLS
uniref:Metallo-beta-lactamase domain-containing protein n=1 Tax=Aplanochytrium stocchinoi TaxID=215587 RepID=A0A7S3LLM5_9STRA